MRRLNLSTLLVAFNGGAVMGVAVASLGLLGVGGQGHRVGATGDGLGHVLGGGDAVAIGGIDDHDPALRCRLDAIEAFVRKGGVLVLWSGVPLYYRMVRKPDGAWDRQGAGETFRQRLHIGWEAWWTVWWSWWRRRTPVMRS